MPAYKPLIRLYQDWLKETRGLSFETYEDFWRWSVTEYEAFWLSLWEFDGLQSPTAFTKALAEERMPGAVWFPGAQVNYARQVFAHADAAHAAGMPAIIAEDEQGRVREISWPELKRQVASLALTLRELGVEKGDRIAAYLPNAPEAIIAFLATTSLGAVWSLCAPDMGVRAVADRFAQIEPKVLIAVDGVHYAGKPMDRGAQVRELLAGLPSVKATVVVQTPFVQTPLDGVPFAEACACDDEATASFEAEWLAFDHPIWIVYSSGTTGLPKPIVHGHGGILMAAAAGGKHFDVGPSYAENSYGERFHWFTSTGWIMWNCQLGGLLSGTTICLYDGSPSGSKDNPDWTTLWRFADRHKVTYFGSGAAFFTGCMKAGVELATIPALARIRALGSTGSPLAPDVQEWGTAQFKSLGVADIWWCNISGGTDFASNFCTAHRELPQQPGKLQCRQLGSSVEAWNEAGEPVIDEVGELVCTRPLPSMPLYFWGDTGNARYLSSYFDVFPGVWRHGDWIMIEPDGFCTIYGRSDATLNRAGLRMGTSEIYSAVEPLPEILDSMVLDLEHLGRDPWLVLFVVLRPGAELDEGLKGRINAAIRQALSPRFTPDAIIQAPEIPRTLSGKKQEVPVKKLFLGHSPDKVMNREAMANPGCIEWYVAQAKARAEAG